MGRIAATGAGTVSLAVQWLHAQPAQTYVALLRATLRLPGLQDPFMER